LTLRVVRGDRVGIVGPNGAGKTTLLNLLTGVLPPDAGTIRLGTNLVLATLDQRRDSLDPEATVAATLTDGRGDTVTINGETRHVIGYLRDFLFRPEQARSPVKSLSGGERGRLMLAHALARPSSLLVLDEPTNDLDLETLDLLQEMLADYPGTLLIASHDRDFLDRLATSVIAFEGNAKWTEYAGGYSDMVAQRGYGVGALRTSPAKPKPATGPTAAPRAPKARRRLTFADQHALKASPVRLEALSAEIHRGLLKGFDFPGLLLMALFLGSLEYVFEEGPRNDWFEDDLIATFAVLAAAGGLLFFWRMFTYRQPIVWLKAFHDRNFAIGSLYSFILGIGLYGSVYLLPAFLGRVRGFNSLQIG
ncbi:MAG: ATP-binding cassette domain-containing protein, partial [Dongiaceae bacterium]